MTKHHAHRAIHHGLAVLLAASLAGAAAPTSAQSVPVPKPAPKGRDGTQLSTQDKGPMTTGATQAPPTPIIPDPRRNLPANIFASFDANQKAQAAKVSNYLSSLQTLVGNFVQVGSDGQELGVSSTSRSLETALQYDPPSRSTSSPTARQSAVRDRKLATQDIYPLSQTPLRYLLSDRIDLLKDTNVVSITADDVFISIIIEEKQALIGTSRMMLMIGTKDSQLKQWTVTDPQGYDTTVAIYNLDSSKKVDPGLFKIDFTSYPTPPN
jgi:outer membrane lipoprotein-sorting protein